jgi:hypothetical protein
MKLYKSKYLEKALLLSNEDQERLLSRMTGNLPRRLSRNKISVDEALAMQLEIEDEQLNEWREKMHALKEMHAAQAKKSAEKNKAIEAAKTKKSQD